MRPAPGHSNQHGGEGRRGEGTGWDGRGGKVRGGGGPTRSAHRHGEGRGRANKVRPMFHEHGGGRGRADKVCPLSHKHGWGGGGLTRSARPMVTLGMGGEGGV